MRLRSLLFFIALTASCGPAGRDVIEQACIEDGNPLGYCQCITKGMREALGPERYPVFTRFTQLGGMGSASPEDILKLMEDHELSPTELAELRGHIGTLSAQIHQQCAP
ncbi:MAG: hypothetical protein ACE363_05405 [Alphaproteobacteria bacterium]